MQRKTRIFTIVGVIVLALIAGLLALYFGPTAREVRGNEAATKVLSGFGANLKNVPLLGDDAAVTTAIEENYGVYVTPELLTDWKENHSRAPGRVTSSPAPDRLGITSMTAQGEGRIAVGEVILTTADGEVVDTVPFVAQLIPTENGWKIAAYQEEKVQTLKNIPTSDRDIPGAR